MRVRAGQRFALALTTLLASASARADSEGEALEDEKGEEVARASGLAAAQGDAHEGPWVRYEAPPELGKQAVNVCSVRVPLCVRARATTDTTTVLAALRGAEDAWTTMTHALALAAPDPDPSTGTFALYLDHAEGGGEARLVARDTRSHVDRARGFGVVDERLPVGCTLDFEVARALIHASLLRTSPAATRATARAIVAEIAQTMVPCAGAGWLEPRAAVYQWSSAAGIATDESHPDYVDGSALFFAFLDRREGRAPLGPTRALIALAATKTPFVAPRFVDEPDLFDVLVTSYQDTNNRGVDLRKRTMDDTWLAFAIARATLPHGSPFAGAFGPAVGMPTVWDIPWPASPRKLASRDPLAPGGSAVLRVHTAGAPAGARLRIEATWEAHAVLRWGFVKLDAQGKEIGRVPIPSPRRSHEAQKTLVDVLDADSVLLVVTSAGDPLFPIDPDDGAWEPHAFNVVVAEEP